MARVPYPILWGKAVTSSELGRRERLVCLALLLHMNIRGVCRPTLKTIEARSGYGNTSVKRALNVLESLGWIVRSTGRTGRANVYQGVIPDGHPRAPTRWAPQSAHQESREEEEHRDDGFGGF